MEKEMTKCDINRMREFQKETFGSKKDCGYLGLFRECTTGYMCSFQIPKPPMIEALETSFDHGNQICGCESNCNETECNNWRG